MTSYPRLNAKCLLLIGCKQTDQWGREEIVER